MDLLLVSLVLLDTKETGKEHLLALLVLLVTFPMVVQLDAPCALQENTAVLEQVFALPANLVTTPPQLDQPLALDAMLEHILVEEQPLVQHVQQEPTPLATHPSAISVLLERLRIRQESHHAHLAQREHILTNLDQHLVPHVLLVKQVLLVPTLLLLVFKHAGA